MLSSTRHPFFNSFLSIALGGLSLTALILPTPAWADQPISRTIAVSGYGQESVPTSLAAISLGVEAQGKTPLDVQQEVARRSSAIVEFLRTQPITKLETQGLSLSPVYDYSQNQQRIVGYSATNIVRFRIETPKAGALMDEAVKRGASRIDSLQFIATDDALATARQAALVEATADAQRQADIVLKALGLSRRDVVNIQVNNSGPVSPPGPFPVMSVAKTVSTTPVQGGDQDVQASVTILFSY